MSDPELGVLVRVASWLADEGTFVANLDLGSVRLSDGRPAGGALSRWLRASGFSYDSARHRIRRTGRSNITVPTATSVLTTARDPTTAASPRSSPTTSA